MSVIIIVFVAAVLIVVASLSISKHLTVRRQHAAGIFMAREEGVFAAQQTNSYSSTGLTFYSNMYLNEEFCAAYDAGFQATIKSYA
jgi:hypothetical protein